MFSTQQVLRVVLLFALIFTRPAQAALQNGPETTCPCSLWDQSALPALPQVSDGVPIELGVKFRSEVSGTITGLRFYKGSLNTGAHTGRLWTASGTELASLTFTNETDSGWQQALFENPVTIQAGTTYVASYFSPSGYFAYDAGYFINHSETRSPLRAPAHQEDGPNGVYRYGSSGFPTEGGGANYWVDVIFFPGGPDAIPLSVGVTNPSAGATNVSVTANISAVFNEPLDPATLTAATFTLRDHTGSLVPASVHYAAGVATLDPAQPLAYAATYTATLHGGPTGLADRAGNRLPGDFTWSFTTAAPPPPPPDQGPSGPILVLTHAARPFTRFYAEILRAEGLNAFTTADLTTLNQALLDQHSVVLLGEAPLTSAQANLLSTWVQQGGQLIAMRPDKKLATLLGLIDSGGVLSEGYLRIDPTKPAGAGLVSQTIQFHGDADRYTLAGAIPLATLYSNATTSTPYPAVTLHEVGANGGRAAAFTYDLARSVVYTRQGNPAWAGQERDGSAPLRSDDLFYPDWVDFDKIAIPQADEQQRLLAHLLLDLSEPRQPLPRFWYFPRDEKAVVIMTGDDHNGNGTNERFDTYQAQSPAGCSLDDWECIRATSYIYEGNELTNAQAAAYEAAGFEIALHLNTGCANYTESQLESMWTDQLTLFRSRYASLAPPVTERTHCIAWSGWAEHAKVSARMGVRLDTNYYYWPADWVQDRPGLFTGSGMPMRFADLDGALIDVYQAPTQLTDEAHMTYPDNINALLDRALGAEGYYGFFTTNYHTDSASHPESDAVVSAAKARGVPVISARQALTWLDGRNASSFQDLSWDGTELRFRVAIAQGARGLRVLVPAQAGGETVSALTLNGQPVSYVTETIKGRAYATFLAAPGLYRVIYGDPPPNHPPVANGQTVTTAEDTPVNITLTGSDPDGDSLTYTIVSGPAHGTLSGTGASRTYTPAANYHGKDSFTFKVSDGKLSSPTAKVSIEVTPVNDAPKAHPQTVTVMENTPVLITLTASDIDGDSLTYTIVTPPSHGSLSGTGASRTYTPERDYLGPDSFTFKASDGSATSNIATVTITVKATDAKVFLPIIPIIR